MAKAIPPSQDMTWKGALRHHALIVGLLLLFISPLALAAYGGVPEGQPFFYGMVAGAYVHYVVKPEVLAPLWRVPVWCVCITCLAERQFTDSWTIASLACVIAYEALEYRAYRAARKAASA